MAHSTNLVLTSRDRTQHLAVGKVVQYGGEFIYHAAVYAYRWGGSYLKLTENAWPVQDQVLSYLLNNGVRKIYYYVTDKQLTLRLNAEDVSIYGVPGRYDQYGRLLYVNEEYWHVAARRKLRTPFIPDEISTELEWVVTPDSIAPDEPSVARNTISYQHGLFD